MLVRACACGSMPCAPGRACLEAPEVRLEVRLLGTELVDELVEELVLEEPGGDGMQHGTHACVRTALATAMQSARCMARPPPLLCCLLTLAVPP